MKANLAISGAITTAKLLLTLIWYAFLIVLLLAAIHLILSVLIDQISRSIKIHKDKKALKAIERFKNSLNKK